MSLDLLERANRMRRVPGIDFTQDYSGWHARVAGAGLEVRQVIKIYREVQENWDGLKAALYWWTDAQLQAALTYYRLYPDEIEEYIAAEDAFEKEARQNGYPPIVMRPDMEEDERPHHGEYVMNPNLVAEVDRMRRVPGIIFTNDVTGRRAEVAGAGLAVWEVIKMYREVQENWHGLKASLYWWSDEQLKAALEYARLYPDDIYPRVEAEESFNIEEFWEKYPFTRPKDAKL